ncbi:MAG: VapE domain-containing protein [Anaerolineales bacterium]|jgi:hypothetical protein
MDKKLSALRWYASHGFPIFPCGVGAKTPATGHGFQDATTDLAQVSQWHAEMPDANWGLACGEAAGRLLVVDIDPRHHGDESWELLRQEHPQPLETVTARTPSGGCHLWFRYPAGVQINSRAGALAPGVDHRCNGGYIVVPPSHINGSAYRFEFPPTETPIADAPEWLLAKLTTLVKIPEPTPIVDDPGIRNARAVEAIGKLKPERADEYQSWLEVGMALQELGPLGLILWDNWSQRSPKYRRGDCAAKWESFKREPTDTTITLDSLFKWAREDSGDLVPLARKNADAHDYSLALDALGLTFALNEMDDCIYINGVPENDINLAVLEVRLWEHGYKDARRAEQLYKATAAEHPFHPIRDYLAAQTWDGQDHIGRLITYFDDPDRVFGTYLRRWLIGAVARAFAPACGVQNAMLVIDGAQGIGKSYLARWLAAPLPAYFIEAPIITEDKDYALYACRRWIWEVAELGSTTRRADREALKFFLSRQSIDVRKAYGKREIKKPALASYIGTLNNEAGFLSDPTGSRRFMACTLRKINWAYAKEINVNQVWAQAKALYDASEAWQLTPEEEQRAREVNERFETENLMVDYIQQIFTVDPALDAWTASSEIYDALKIAERTGSNRQQDLNLIGAALRKLGTEVELRWIDGKKRRGWRGVKREVVADRIPFLPDQENSG